MSKAKIFQSLKFQCILYHAFENGLLTNHKEKTAYIRPARQYFMFSIVCCSYVRLVNKMLTGILRLIATPYANSTCEKERICSFILIYDEEVTLRKKNLYWDISQPLRQETVLYSLPLVALRCPYGICSSLVALVALSFSTSLMKIVRFYSTSLYPFLL